MDQSCAPAGSGPYARAGRLLTGYPAAAVLLVLFWVMAVTGVAQKSATFDEPAHLAVGYSHLASPDYRLDPANGPLPQRLAALPLLGGPFRFPDLDQPPYQGADCYAAGAAFLYGLGNDGDALLFRARAAAALLGVALGLVIYLWSRELFGPGGALLSLVLFVFCPNFLAHAPLVTSDVALAAALTFSVWRWWKLLHEVTWGTLALSALAFALLLLAKMSAVVVLPMLALLLVIRLFSGEPLRVRSLTVAALIRLGALREVRGRTRQGVVLATVVLAHLAAGVLMIWACYGLRYSAFPEPAPGAPAMTFRWEDYPLDRLTSFGLETARAYHLLPENYLFTFAHVAGVVGERQAFLNGAWSNTGWWYFFPCCVGFKTTLGVWLVVLLATAAAWFRRRAPAPAPADGSVARTSSPCATYLHRQDAGATAPLRPRSAFYRTAPLWVLLAVYAGLLLASRLNLGLRHALPLYPPLFILAGAAAHWFRTPRRAAQALVLLGLGIHGVESLAVRPHYLAFFNLSAGGPRQGYRRLVDSALDWGQDLPGLKRWLAEHPARAPDAPETYIAYFGTASLDYYRIPARRLPGFYDQRPRLDPAPLRGGVYCISATLLQSIGSWYPGPWSASYEEQYRNLRPEIGRFLAAGGDPAAQAAWVREQGPQYWSRRFDQYERLRFARLCAWLRGRTPDEEVGYSILIYRLTDAEVRQALEGPL